jgi:5'-nucleotidase/UDP-sugar diphosphatase
MERRIGPKESRRDGFEQKSVRTGWRVLAFARMLSVGTLVLALLTGATPAGDDAAIREVTILYTNDFHSAFDPIPAYWLPGAPRLGGAAHLATLMDKIRAREKPVFLFDTGDMFTGMLSNLTRGEALMEMMRAMRYDAMAIGNHEFDYGADNFLRQMNGVPFPVLGANIFYKGTDHPYSRPYVILEKDGVRLGVIGIIGEDARSVALPSGITNLDFRDPVPIVRALVGELRDRVDVVVVLAHQGKTGPMQSDAEARPEVQRDFDEDVRLCGQVEGIDVFVGGHAHRGIEPPFVHPATGTVIVQTFGYGTRLGYLKLKLEGRRVVGHEGELLKVWTDENAPDPAIAALIESYRKRLEAQIGQVLGRSRTRLVRDYRAESSLGDFVSDVMREATGAEVAVQNAGGLRADIPEGTVTNGHVLDALPFLNTVVEVELTGAQLREVLEQGLTLERGLVQTSGLRGTYDLSRPAGRRLVSIEVGGRPLADARVYRVATNSFVAEGGDLYATFLKTRARDSGRSLADVVMEALRRQGEIGPPPGGRFVPVPPPKPRRAK